MLYPLNKHLVVEPLQDEDRKEESAVLVPDGIEITNARYKLVKLIEPHADSKLRPGMQLLTPAHLIESVSILGKEYYLISEGHVVAFYEVA